MTNKIDKIQMPNGQVLELNGGGSTWGLITGNIAAQTDLQTALNNKQDKGNYALKSEIPTKTSQLTNDSDYITSSYHDSTKQDKLTAGDNIAIIDNVISAKGGPGLEVGDIGMALYVDETKGLRRYLNGQIVDINTNTQAFLNRLLEIQTTNPEYFSTEDNWQSEALLNIDGCVYKFVLNYSGETVVSVRLPKYPDYVEINAGGTLPVVGNGMALGLTNGTTNGGVIADSTSKLLTYTGAYGANVKNNLTNEGSTIGKGFYGVTSDPTKSGLKTTLKQTKLKMRYFIQIATGSETENNIINDIELNNPYSLFDSKYSDHELNNLSWLKSEGQWNAKAVYPDAYDELLREYNNPDRLATFNRDAFEVVGSPTITDDGVASGFSNSDYLINNLPALGSRPFKIITKVNTGNAGTYRYICKLGTTDYRSVFLISNENQLVFWTVVNDGNNTDITPQYHNIPANTDLFVKVEWDGNYYWVSISYDGETWLDSTKRASTYPLVTYNQSGIYIGHNGAKEGSYDSGSIDLKQFSITVDGVKVFSGAKSKVKLSTEQYTDYDFVLNTADETFRLPLLNGSENLPSQKFDNLALTSSDSIYIAPANGRYYLKMNASTGQFINMHRINASGDDIIISHDVSVNNLDVFTEIEVRKGDKVRITHNTSGNVLAFKFIYAQGNGSLYFYVGETVQNANLIDAGRIGEQLVNKQDKCIHIIDTYINGTSGYRIWSDGYCEQWGASVNASNVTFLKKFINTDWNFVGGVGHTATNYGYDTIKSKTVSGFTFFTYIADLVFDVRFMPNPFYNIGAHADI